MKAAVINSYGGPEKIVISDQPEPELQTGMIKIAVRSAAVNPIDWKIRSGQMLERYGHRFPKILGFDLSGDVLAVAQGVAEFKVGDAVFARGDIGDGGAYAEVNVVRASSAALKPKSINYQQAAALPLCALTALQCLRDCAQIKPGDSILLNGAVGGVGVIAIQLAKLMGAQVTAVTRTENHALAKSLGADYVIDYQQEPVFKAADNYDLIFDLVGVLGYQSSRQFLSCRGIYISLVYDPGINYFVLGETHRETGFGYFVLCEPRAADLDIIADWVDSAKLQVIVDKIYPLESLEQAHRYSEQGRAVGKIVISIS